MIKAYSYIRMSSKEQLKGASFRRQSELTEKYAQEHNLQIDNTICDLGVSAFSGKNITDGALGKFIQLCKDGGIEKGSVLIVENLDRISRQKPLHAFKLFASILDEGIEIVTLVNGQRFTEDSVNSDMSQLYMSIGEMIRAHSESKTKSDRLKDAWDRKRNNLGARKLTSRCPAWLELSTDKKSFIPNSERFEIVERIFNLMDEGLGSYSIVKLFYREGVPTFCDSTKWHTSYLTKIL